MDGITETIVPYIRPPWWVANFTTNISATKEEAIAQHNIVVKEAASHKGEIVVIYTDGSGIDGKVGAAAVNHMNGDKSRMHLGREADYNVFIAEVEGVRMGVRMFEPKARKCYIYVDSQSAIQALQNPRRQSGQAAIGRVLHQIDCVRVQNPALKIAVCWIPGHEGIAGNELADQVAKRAATRPLTTTMIAVAQFDSLQPPPPLKSALKQRIKEDAKRQWQREWDISRTGNALRRIISKGARVGPKLYKHIVGRYTATTIAQLRTGHCRLNKYLHRFKLKTSPYCECGYGQETVEHYLMECPRFIKERKELRIKVRSKGMSMERLLGDPKFVKHTMEYVKATGRFESRSN
ncbi:MAG: hypothetical protein E6H10_00790 [Bacteroidetes bacterium]|nr:MAG: hypothetical protein E6H10_00790 [Bacteroidota bacterium]